MRIKYVGPCADGVEVAATGQVACPGDVLEVDDDLGAALCDQVDDWQPDDAAAAKVLTARAKAKAKADQDVADQPAGDSTTDATSGKDDQP